MESKGNSFKVRRSTVKSTRPDYNYKAIVVGNSGVGKTSFIYRAATDAFLEKHDITIITDLTKLFFNINAQEIQLQIWDTCGLEQYRSMNKVYYRGSDIALVLYDITDAKSFKDCSGFIKDLRNNCDGDISIYLIGTKSDLENREVKKEDILSFMSVNKIINNYDVSAKTGKEVAETIEDIIKREYIKKILTKRTSVDSFDISRSNSQKSIFTDANKKCSC